MYDTRTLAKADKRRSRIASLAIVTVLLALAIALPVAAGASLGSVAIVSIAGVALGAAIGLVPGLPGTVLAVIGIGVGVGLSTSWFGSSGIGAWSFSFAAGLGIGLRLARHHRRAATLGQPVVQTPADSDLPNP
jgi:hypothetical protein